MLTAEGCRERRRRLLEAFQPREPLVLADPIHLRYLANFHVDPFSLGADFGGFLILAPDGQTTLIHDNRLPASVKEAHVDTVEVVPWYDGQSPGKGVRRLVLRDAVFGSRPARIHDSLADPDAPRLLTLIGEMRRSKDEDEMAVLRECMRAGEVGQHWALLNIEPGMTELQAYTGISQACSQAVGQAVILYGDFAVSPGPAKRGGAATQRVLEPGDMLILDFSVVRFGYRSDFTNTLVIGKQPTLDQFRLHDACVKAMVRGELELKPGASCQAVYDAVHAAFASEGLGDAFPHHAGHGLGLSHPESPYLVRHSTETLVENDVVTLEPGVYVEGIGGIRIEHNYRVTPMGFEQLSKHSTSMI